MSKQVPKANGMNRIAIWGWVLLIGFLVFQWVLYATSAAIRPGQFQEAVGRVEQMEKTAREKGGDDRARIETLTKKSLFAPPPERPKPPQCVAILGDSVLIDGQWYRVGQEVKGAKIQAIDATSVTLLFEENELKQYPFESGGGQGGGRGDRSSRGGGSRGRPRGEMPERAGGPPEGFGGPGGGRGFLNMSDQDREQMRQRFEQMRQQYESMSPEEQQQTRERMREEFRRNFQR